MWAVFFVIISIICAIFVYIQYNYKLSKTMSDYVNTQETCTPLELTVDYCQDFYLFTNAPSQDIKLTFLSYNKRRASQSTIMTTTDIDGSVIINWDDLAVIDPYQQFTVTGKLTNGGTPINFVNYTNGVQHPNVVLSIVSDI